MTIGEWIEYINTIHTPVHVWFSPYSWVTLTMDGLRKSEIKSYEILYINVLPDRVVIRTTGTGTPKRVLEGLF